MHELSVCLALLDQLERIAANHDATVVTRIEISLGPLSGIEVDLLRNAWPLASAGSRAEHATLDIHEATIVVTCSECGRESAAEPNRLLCRACGGYRTRVISGEEMILDRVELGGAKRRLNATERALS